VSIANILGHPTFYATIEASNFKFGRQFGSVTVMPKQLP